jgi:hypothetical protein
MNPLSPSFTAAFFRVGAGLAALLLASCSHPTAARIGVSSPPAPLVGSVPIAAYDDYARSVTPAAPVRGEAIAQVAAP